MVNAGDMRIGTWYAVEREFEKFTFDLPGWSMKITAPARSPWDGVGYNSPASDFYGFVTLFCKTKDTYSPSGDEIVVQHRFTLPPIEALTPNMLADFLRHCVHNALCHEADEWLKRSGVMLFDPHKRGM